MPQKVIATEETVYISKAYYSAINGALADLRLGFVRQVDVRYTRADAGLLGAEPSIVATITVERILQA